MADLVGQSILLSLKACHVDTQRLILAAQAGAYGQNLFNLAFKVIEGNAHGVKFPGKV